MGDVGSFLPGGVSVNQAAQLLWPVGVYVLGMAVYAVFIFRFYRFIAGRDIFTLDFSKNDNVAFPVFWDFIFLVWYVARYVVLFPAFALFWFAVLTLMLAFLSENRDLSEILLIALATVSAIRICAYYDEDLSRDLAKILPFAVLAIFLIDTSFFDVGASLAVLQQANEQRETIFYYLLFIVGLELALRFVYGMYRAVFPGKKEPKRREPSTTSPDRAEAPAASDN